MSKQQIKLIRNNKGVQQFLDNVDLENAETEEEIRACLNWTCPFCRGHDVSSEEGGRICSDARVQKLRAKLPRREQRP